MGRFIQYSGSLFVLGVLLLIIYRMALEQGFIPKNFTKNQKVAVFFDLSILVLIMQAAVLVVGFIIFNAAHGKINFFEFEKIWLRGDAKNMVDLAANIFSGNPSPQGMPTSYPLMLKLAAIPFANFYFLAGLILSCLAMITACYFFYHLIILDYTEQDAKNSVKFLLFFPFSFCLFFPVPESLFLAFSIAAFYYMRKQNWFVAGIWSLLTVLCDLRGTLLILPVLYEIGQLNRGKWRIIFPLGFITLGCLAILAFNQLLSGNSLAFLNHYSSNFNFINHAWNTDIRVFYGNVLPLLVLLALVILGGFSALGKIRPSYLLYAVPLSAAAFFIPWLDNQPRFFTVVFPFFMGLGLFTKNRTANMILLFVLTVFLGLYLFCDIFFKMSF
jgi:hypothetical protein